MLCRASLVSSCTNSGEGGGGFSTITCALACVFSPRESLQLAFTLIGPAEAPEVSTTCLVTTLKKTIDWGIVRIVELAEIDFDAYMSEEVEVAIDTKSTDIGGPEIRVGNGVGGADLQVAKATCSRSGLGCGQ